MGTLMIGYDVEAGTSGDLLAGQTSMTGAEVTRRFAEKAKSIHQKHGLPGTLFVVGQKFENEAETFAPLVGDPYLELAQHSYSHMALKPCLKDVEGRLELWDWPTAFDAQEAETELVKANDAFASAIGSACHGLSAPFSYFLGFVDRPDLLAVLRKCGIRYLRSFHLNKETTGRREPLPLNFRPFHYGSQGYPEIIDFCVKGYSDVGWALKYGWDSAESYLNYVKHSIDMVNASDAVWGLVAHDFSLIHYDSNLQLLDEILSYASKTGIETTTFGDMYDRLSADSAFMEAGQPEVDWRVVYSPRTAG
jgi:peptidoglycan/xylan/chitin deacetylase (PgdA/CDA1 family)